MSSEHSTIGTLNERSLHAFLKTYYEPDPSLHEVKVGRYTADICSPQGLVEIQTRNFSGFKRKLGVLLAERPVTVVYPVAEVKRIIWLDEQTGDATRARKSPRAGTIYDACNELIYIKDLLCHQNLTLRITLMEMTDIRSLNGWSNDRKKGSERLDRVPVSVMGEVDIRCSADYSMFLPEGLPAQFTAKEFLQHVNRQRTQVTPRLAQKTLYVLTCVGTVRRVGKRRNAILYEAARPGTAWAG